MATFYDEQVDFKQGGDSGDNASSAIQPITGSEYLLDTTLNRPLENLRKRVELLKKGVEEAKYYLDSDRSLILASAGKFVCTDDGADGLGRLQMVGGDLLVIPALTPGQRSGGRYRGGRVFVGAQPYAGTALVNDLILVADGNYTGMRGYADGSDFTADANALSLGANGVVVTLVANPAVAGGSANITATVTGAPKRKITITYGTSGTPSTIADVITFINGDTTSQGSYGIGNILRASTTGNPASAPPTLTNGVIQGAYDAEAHVVTTAQLDAFFLTTVGGGYVNRLDEGEALAISFAPGPVETGVVAPKGGRRQSLYDLPTNRAGSRINNTSPSVGHNLFNTGREPEKIPGSIPIGKMIDGRFVFADGVTTLELVPEGTDPADGSPLGVNLNLLIFLASQSGSTGAGYLGYGGSGNWNADQTAGLQNIPQGTVENAIDEVAASLGRMISGDSGSRRLGGEEITGSVTTGDLPLGLPQGSVRQQLDYLLNAASSVTEGGGINHRVSERGHGLVGTKPMEKVMNLGATPAAGAVLLRARLDSIGSMNQRSNLSSAEYVSPANMTLLPITMNDGAGNVLQKEENIAAGGSTNTVVLTALDATKFLRLIGAMQLITNFNATYGGGVSTPVPSLIVQIKGFTAGPSGDGPGYYFVLGRNTALREVALFRLDGVTAANFTGATFTPGTSKVSFFASIVQGTSKLGELMTIVAPPTLHGAVTVYATHLPFDIGGFATYAAVPWLTSFVPDVVYNPAVIPTTKIGARFYGDHAEWINPATGIISRETNNILQTSDASVLKGVENANVIDGSPSHHHGAQLSRTVMYETVFNPSGWQPKSLSLIAPAAGLQLVTATQAQINTALYAAGERVPTALSTKFRKRGVILRCVVKLTTKVGVSSGDRIFITIAIASDGGIRHREHLDWRLSAGGVQSRFFSFQVTVPVARAGAVYSEGPNNVAVILGAPDIFPSETTDDGAVGLPAPINYATGIDDSGGLSFMKVTEIGSIIDFFT